ncbi:YidC/Oxa1 family membrane protein insertase [Streptomyces sp. RB6PN25]|uniref:Membrane protein insertase YidC n=1 Tax=Streptomyces humicola TaxID=2953240 RepID=A0ABT1Q1J5_9ACTN|nr:membrane protein insertase YidC [Streptomyces humicola]MCQ4083805.1 YidC/Oxa1 family membrane protein insertase [Streptomyces humicola]
MFVFTPLIAVLSRLADGLQPLFGASATAAAVVVFTVCVRLALHPLARAAARAEKTRARLAPRVAQLSAQHKGDRQRLQRAMTELYAKEGVSPLAGCLPMLLQTPFFFVMNRLFWSGGGGLLDHRTLFGAPLDGRWLTVVRHGGVFGPHGLVFLALFAVLAAVATWTYRRTRRTTAGLTAPGAAGPARIVLLMPFATLATAAVVPLAAGLYLVTTTTWTAVERAFLHREPKMALDAAESTG